MRRNWLIICLAIIILVLSIMLWKCSSSLQQCSVQVAERGKVIITAPAQGSQVKQAHLVRGRVSNPQSVVVLMVHPLNTDGYWVQPRARVDSLGYWKVEVYFGRPGKDVGAELEIRAFTDPPRRISPGKHSYWIQAKASSDIVTVIRE